MNNREFSIFDKAMHKILSVSHDELQYREKKWKKEQKRKKRKPKTSASGRASRAKD